MRETCVLIVDDTPSERVLLRHALGGMRHPLRLLEAGSHDEALAVMRQTRIDVAFLDIRLPGRSGLDLLTAARGINPDLFAVIVSNESTKATVLEARRRQTDAFVVKPYNLAKLNEVFARYRARSNERAWPVDCLDTGQAKPARR